MEAAVVLFFVLVPLTLGVIQYSWLFLKAQQITNAARCGARAAIRYGATTGDVQYAIDKALEFAGIGGPGTITPVPPLDINPGVGNEVTVKLKVSTSTPGVSLVNFFPGPDNLRASVTMAKEGP